MTKDELKLALAGLEEWRLGGDPRAADKYITAIKEALAQPTSSDYALGYSIGFGEGHSAGKALAQPEQENKHIVQSNGKHSPLLTHMMNKQPKTEQEPVAKYSDIVSDGGLDPRNKFDTTPPQRTDKERILQLIKELRPAIKPLESMGRGKTTNEWFDILVKDIEEKL